MEGKGPYRIYDPGGARETALDRLAEENAALKEKMKGIRSLGKDQTVGSFTLPDQDEKTQEQDAKNDQKSPGSGASSDFEIVPADESERREKGCSPGSGKLDLEPPQYPKNADSALLLQLQRLESSLSDFAEEPDRNQLFTHLGRMALEFNRLAAKVHKNEQKTSVLQTLCEQLRKENEDLRKNLEKDLEQRSHDTENLRVENMELKRKVTLAGKDILRKVDMDLNGECPGSGDGMALERIQLQQTGKLAENVTVKDVLGVTEKKVKALEHQRNELLEVNKQWDKHFRSMKQQYEQKITSLRQKLSDSQKLVTDLEAEREQKQRDFERKLLLAKSKIETEEGEKKVLEVEVQELIQKNRFLQDQLAPVSRQREYQEKEIQRLNKALEEALSVQASAPPPSLFSPATEAGGNLRRQEQLTQIQLLKQQVKIFEEDFQRERSDRERMSEEKENLKHQMEKLQTQFTQQNAQAIGERLPSEHHPGTLGPMFPPYQYPFTQHMPHPMYQGFEDWQIHFPPGAGPAERPPVQDSRHLPPPEYPWWVPCRVPRNLPTPGGEMARGPPKDSDSSAVATPSNQQPI
ncbi:TNFAIP3-interacting protein 1 isoform X4 [Ambystoma mexicanum]|uniref:TNFAIP3-interacting protein 1 isoform X4 n=1 Tax=Ambystoma mexicanum TaxID=8296 RepID=UPI0037E776FE